MFGPFFMHTPIQFLGEESITMRRFAKYALASGVLLGGLFAASTFVSVAVAGDDEAVLQADHALVQAVGKADKAALGKLLAPDFTWTDSDGKTQSRAEVLQKSPSAALGDETGVELTERTYGQVATAVASRGKLYVLRVWMKRKSGWQALVYHEVKLADQPPTSPGTGVKDCENPCKTVPYSPRNDAERGVFASWQALETGVTEHDADAWAPHIADEFVMFSSNNDRPISRADRIATLNKQRQSGAGSAPSPLVSARLFDLGDTVVMTCQHQPHRGKPVHVTRVWVKRDGHWVMITSYQTTIQAAPARTE
jgi:Domain of unknown function (DUF4440)